MRRLKRNIYKKTPLLPLGRLRTTSFRRFSGQTRRLRSHSGPWAVRHTPPKTEELKQTEYGLAPSGNP